MQTVTDSKETRQGPRALVVLVIGALLAGLLVLLSGAPALAAPPDSNPLATWNMQRSSGRWQTALDLSDRASVVALQEVSIVPPAGAQRLPNRGSVRAYRIPATRTRGERFVFILPQGRNPGRGLNLAMITSFLPDRVTRIPGVYRDALAVTRRADNTLIASIHASASGSASQLSGGQLDYAVSNVDSQNWQATRGNNRGSDHWPVTFSAMRAGGANPTRFTITDEGNSSVLDVTGGSRAIGTHVIVYHPDGGTNQVWRRYKAGFLNRFDRVVSLGKCLDVDGGPLSRAGSQMNIWDCHPSAPSSC